MNQPPGDAPGRLPVDFRPRRLILLPYNDLLIDQGLDQFLSIDTSGFKLGLVLPYGMGPTEPKVFQMDANGALVVTTAGQAAVGAVALSSPSGIPNQFNGGLGDGNAVAAMYEVAAFSVGFNGATFDRLRTASPANLAAQSGKGAMLATDPGEWAINANPALGAVATVTQAAGAAGVRHICQGYCIVVTSQVAPAAGTLVINVRDGASGAGGVLEAITLQIPAALYAPIVITRSGINLVGTAGTAMTIESTAAYAAVGVSLNLEGYDAV